MTQSPQTPRTGLCLRPLDGLFFRDGRPFGPASRLQSGRPLPQTLAGALRTFLLERAGCDFRRLGEAIKAGASFAAAASDGQPPEGAAVAGLAFRGPWFARLAGGRAPEPFVPAPATLRRLEDGAGFTRLDPLVPARRLPGWEAQEPDRLPLWPRSWKPAEKLDGFLEPAGLERFLQGGVPEPGDLVPVAELFAEDPRTGIAIDPGALVAAEGLIYAVTFLALASDVGLYAEVLSGDAAALDLLPETPAPLPLGGEGRRVGLATCEPFAWPSVPPGNGQRPLTLLTSPGLFGGPSPQALRPVASAVPGAVPVSGWDLARGGPKPTRFAAAAGSVYFLDQLMEPAPASLCNGEDAALGWGSYLQGVWNHV